MTLHSIEAQKLFAAEGTLEDRLGSSASIEGKHAIVGAWHDDIKGVESGSASIYTDQGDGAFIETQRLFLADGSPGDYFGHSVAISKHFAIVGAPGDDTLATDSGAVYLFKKNSHGQFEQMATLRASDGGSGDRFGDEIAIDADERTIAITGGGAVYLFRADTHGQFDQGDKVSVPDVSFGHKVAIHAAYLIVSSFPDEAITDQPAYVYKDDGTGHFVLKAQLYGAGPDARTEKFGSSVAISGSFAVVGARGDDDLYGKVYLYRNDGHDAFDQIAVLTPSERTPGDRFGWSVALRDQHLLVGAFWHGMQDYWGSHADAKGAAFLFKEDGSGDWTELSKLIASNGSANDHFGESVALSDQFALVGSPQNEAKAKNAGAVYLFDLKDSILPISSYQTRYFSGQSDDQLKAIITLCDSKAQKIAQLLFHDNTTDIPSSDCLTSSEMISCHYGSEHYSEVLDLLRHESLIFLHLDRLTDVAHLATVCGPIGEP